ncbi:hypothetical protein HMPREF0530_1598 [Lacticaseibacillus paracasei subsp. paracasei ATCC 25302 = DSM 5622 = JCM 8130]|nr:hypothetical protein HMPREF0530_1598 [Lacticaseibacillus paracasei subsp. paracasei ATCC 25302 = DSM 5622 = JCM 8130]KRM65576.1 hypothetical protein FC74_GL000839 [Lacticaseibacillus paracasei subsp. paracasei ATCC 25302 = DSM 5622 = JCM 8130]
MALRLLTLPSFNSWFVKGDPIGKPIGSFFMSANRIAYIQAFATATALLRRWSL